MPGGFGTRGIEGKILAAEWARTAKKPYLGKRHTLLLLCTWLSDFSQVSLCALSAVYCWGPVKNYVIIPYYEGEGEIVQSVHCNIHNSYHS